MSITRERQISNLKNLEWRKHAKLSMLHARKVGQIRAYQQAKYILQQEIKKETRELALIEQEIKELSE